MELWAVHRSLAVDAPVTVGAAGGWPPALLDAVLHGAGFVPEHGVQDGAGVWRRARTLADTVDEGMNVLLVGLNPSVYSADVGSGFARPGNRFWPAATAAGLVSVARDPLHALTHHHVGMTDLVKRATARADELDPSEYRTGLERLRLLVEWLQPGVVCIVGLTGWRLAVDRRAIAGVQPEPFAGRPVYLMPNPSGLNAHVTVDGLSDHFRAALGATLPR
ncbi:MAG: mismatch-specific DNA-glycosylase [Acidimicrobiales bacterium]